MHTYHADVQALNAAISLRKEDGYKKEGNESFGNMQHRYIGTATTIARGEAKPSITYYAKFNHAET